jgi:hypothetical protein
LLALDRSAALLYLDEGAEKALASCSRRARFRDPSWSSGREPHVSAS